MKKELQKNLYDLEYAKALNHENTFVIIIATFVIGFVLSTFSLKQKLETIFIASFLVFYVYYTYKKKLDSIKEKISAL